ncbi:MAG: hypothetical protein U0Q12_00775 [Vicinamibacterales bacterium]
MSHGFLGLMATQMEHRINGEGAHTTCIKAGLLAVYKGFPPAIAIDGAARADRASPSFDETEQAQGRRSRPPRPPDPAAGASGPRTSRHG